MSILTIENLTHSYDGKVLFENASFSINNGEHTGIVGLNGAGKSTFMNIICNKILQDDGIVKWLPKVKWGYLDQHAQIDKTQTCMKYLQSAFSNLFKLDQQLQEIYQKMSTETDADVLDKLITKSASMMDTLTKNDFFDLEANIKKVANGLGIGQLGWDTKIETLSGGQRAKLVLANLLLSDVDVMLLDEPTNFLDIEHVAWLVEYLQNYPKTFLVISHDTDFLNKVCKNILSVEEHKIKKYSGNYDEFLLVSQQNAKQYEESYKRQQAEIKKMEDYIAKNKSRAATASMANSRKKMLDRIDVLEKPHTIYPSKFSFPYVSIHTKDMLIAKDLVIGYSKPLLPAINLHMSSETKIWIRGTNGIGKSTLIKTLMSKIPKLSGDFYFSINSKRQYLEQDLDFSKTEQNATSYFSGCFPLYNFKDVKSKLSAVGIKNELSTRPLCNMSGGEQVKVVLCTLMQKPCNFLILDEPTNHLDVVAKEALKDALKKFEGAIILVSHETAFANEVCNDVLDLY